MQRRHFMQLLGASATTLAVPLASAKAKPATKTSITALPVLDAGKWAPATLARVEGIIKDCGIQSPKYNAAKKPYVVFDWDNTSIMNDTEEALFMYQINNLAFALSPEEFGAVIVKGVPEGNFAADYKNADGAATSLASVSADLISDYTFLYANYKELRGSKSLEEIQATDQFLDFRAKLYFLYEAINDTYGPNIGYPWVIFLFGGMTAEQVGKLAEASNDLNLGDAIRKTKYTSPKTLPGKAGVVTTAHTHGLRLTPEISSLMNALRANGFDVYVSTASLEEVVRVFATLPKYGYRVAPENVLGLRLEMDGTKFKAEYRKGWPLNWGPGKSEVIRSELIAKKGYGPVIVLGDSDGDVNMLKDFPDTQVGVLVNRLKKGNIGSLCKLASEQAGQPGARFVLQGREERTGQWTPDESTLKLGASEKKLLG